MQSMYLSLFIYSMCFFTVYTVIFHLSICFCTHKLYKAPPDSASGLFITRSFWTELTRRRAAGFLWNMCFRFWITWRRCLVGTAHGIHSTARVWDVWRMKKDACSSHEIPWLLGDLSRPQPWARCRLSHLSPTPATAGCITSQCGPNPSQPHIFA